MVLNNGYNFLTPAKVHILLVPVNDCTTTNFHLFKGILKESAVKLQKESEEFKSLLFEFHTSPIDSNQIYLHEFEPFRKTFIVIGIGSSAASQPVEEHLSQLMKIYSTAIVHDVILVEKDSSSSRSNSSSFEEVTFKLAKTLSSYLAALHEYASAYSAITLRSPVSITDSHVLTKTISQAQKRLSSGSTSFRATFNGEDSLLEKKSTSSSDKSKAQSKFSGRHLKLMGNFHLLSGRYSDALQSFSDCLAILKRHDDYLWLGSALEGLAVSCFLLDYFGITYQLSPSLGSTLHLTKASLAENNGAIKKTSFESSNGSKLSIASPRNSLSSNGFGLPLSSSSFTTIDANSLPLLELLKLVLTKAIYYYSQSTCDPENMVPDVVYIDCILRKLSLMVGCKTRKSVDPVMDDIFTRETSDSNTFSNQDILCDIDKVFLLQLVDLNVLDQCKIFSYIACVYRELGLYRKQGFITRFQLIALMPQLAKQNPSNVKDLLESLFDLYRINSEPEISATDATLQSQGNWTSLQIQVLKLGLNIAEQANDDGLLVGLCILLLTRYAHCLPVDDQNKLLGKIEERNQLLKMPYWDPFLVKKVKFVSTKLKDSMVPFAEQDEDSSEPSSFFDPYSFKFEANFVDRIVLKDEIHQLKIVLQNPFAFSIEIHDIEVVSKGVKVETIKELTESISNYSSMSVPNLTKVRANTKKSATTISSTTTTTNPLDSVKNSLVLPPMTTEQFLVSFKASEVGEMEIEGLLIQVCCCEPQFFPIVDHEIVTDSFRLEGKKRGKEADYQSSTFILPTIDNLLSNLTSSLKSFRVTHRTLPLTVIPSQPRLKMKDISLENSWAMLLEGEHIDFSVTLINDSLETINYLSFSFWDSALSFINKRLSQQSLNAAEIYELEWHLLNFKSFRIKNKHILGERIGPREEITIEFELTGRKMMRESRIVLDYAHKSEARSFIKHLEIPINTSVVPSLELVGCNIIPMFSKNTILQDARLPKNVESLRQFIMNEANPNEFCLLLLDLRNSWTSNLKCYLKYDTFELIDEVECNKTKRLFLPVRKMHAVERKPIPSLRQKQFVKDYSLTEEEENQMKKLFWLKQEILGKLVGHWRVKKRRGTIDLRGIKMSAKMADILVLEDVEVKTRILTEDRLDIDSDSLRADEFYILQTKIINHTSESINGFVRQLPLAAVNSSDKQLQTDRKILIEGVLQSKFPTVQPHSEITTELSFVIIERGEYEWGTLIDTDSSQHINKKPLCINVQ